MKEINQHRLESRYTASLINCLIASVGVILILIAVLIQGVVSTILLSVGTSVLATAIVTFLNSKYLIKQSKINDVIQSYGLDGIYKTRAESNAECNQLLKSANTLDICAMGLKNFRESQGTFIEQKVSSGMKIKILTIDPNSSVLSEIDVNENNALGTTKKTIVDLIEWTERLKSKALYEGQIQIRIYDRYPYDFYFCINGHVFTGPYHNKSSQQTITYKYLAKTFGANLFTDNFNFQWENAENV